MTAMLPEWYILLLVSIFGAIIGSFLNVLIYRLHTGKSINGHSHCLSCGTRLLWYELVPVVSYLCLRARCRNCGSYIPARYLLVEILTASSFLGAYFFTEDWYTFGILALLAIVLIIITVYDIYHLIIPDELVALLGGVAGGLWLYENYTRLSFNIVTEAALSASVAFGFFAFLWWISRGRWLGFGDAKLAAPLGFLLPLTGVFSMIVLAFWIGAFISVIWLGIQALSKRGQYHLPIIGTQLTMGSEVPFAPFLILGFVSVFFFNIYVLTEATVLLQHFF